MSMTALGVNLPTRRKREKQAARLLGFGRVLGVGWWRGPVLLVQASDDRRAEAIRTERTRVARMTGKDGAELVVEACYADGKSVEVRRALAAELARHRIVGDLYDVDSGTFASALVRVASALGVREIDAAARESMIEAKLMETMAW